MLYLKITVITFKWVKPLLALFQKEAVKSVPLIDSDPSHLVAPQYKYKVMIGPVTNQSSKILCDIVNHSFEHFASYTYMPVKHFEEKMISYSYKGVGEKVHRFGAVLRQEGLVPAPEDATLDAITTPCSLATP